MTIEEASAIFSSYSPGEKADFLAQLGYELTVIMRDAYEAGGDGLADARRARRVNEAQHRVSSFLLSVLRNDQGRYPDEVFVRIVLDQPDDPGLARTLGETFARLASQRLTAA